MLALLTLVRRPFVGCSTRLRSACVPLFFTHVFHFLAARKSGFASSPLLARRVARGVSDVARPSKRRQLPTTNVLALATMKNAAKCDT